MYLCACFVSTAKSWTGFQSTYLKIRKTPYILSGGLQLASDYMVQDVIPLTSTIGYQNNTHIVLHLVDGNPDMGRKVFQPEIKAVADELSRRVVDVFKGYLALMREDTGTPGAKASGELWNFKIKQIDYRNKNPLSFSVNGRNVALKSVPQQEQDVIGLFHELIGMTLSEAIKSWQRMNTSVTIAFS